MNGPPMGPGMPGAPPPQLPRLAWEVEFMDGSTAKGQGRGMVQFNDAVVVLPTGEQQGHAGFNLTVVRSWHCDVSPLAVARFKETGVG